MEATWKHLILGFFSLALLVSTLFVPVRADDAGEMKNMRLGYPFHFLAQDFSGDDRSFSFFPRYERFDFAKRDQITLFSPIRFLSSWALVFLAVEAAVRVLESTNLKTGKIWRKNRCVECPAEE